MEKRDVKALSEYIESRLPLILEARNKVSDAGGVPNVIYIGDIFPRKENELRPSAVQVDTGSTVFGMKIIADYRVPFDQLYIMQGRL